jgi:hypothetical protein
VTTVASTVVRWVAWHALARLAFRRPYRAGDPQARLLLDPPSADPYPGYARLRERGPIVAGPLVHTAAGYEVAAVVLRGDGFGVGTDPDAIPRPARAVVSYAMRSGVVGPLDPPSLLALNPPDHTRLRRLVGRAFTPRAMEAMRGRVTEIADDLLDRLDGEVDLVGRYASLLPVTVIAEILGVPVGMRERFLAWGRAASPVLEFGLSWREFRRAERALREMNEWLLGHFARLRRSPGDDLLSQLVQIDELTSRDLLATSGLLLAAGFETTVNLLGTGIRLLLDHPDQRVRLAADPGGWPNAVEEILRYDSPVQITARRALRDVDVAGRTIRRGTFVSVLIGGANRDPAVFADPDRFDVGRANARDHLAFSAGAHYCVGAALARLEGEIGLRRLFERFPDLVLAGPPRRRPTRTLRGYDALPVKLG